MLLENIKLPNGAGLDPESPIPITAELLILNELSNILLLKEDELICREDETPLK